MDDRRINRCLEPGASVLVGTVDRQGMPSCCRAVALASTDKLATATVYVPLATSHETMKNVAATRCIAVVATHAVEHASVQLKGTVLAARLARDDEAPFVRRRLDELAEGLDLLGVPRRLTRSVAHWPAFAIELRVEEIYEQTPGPNAGSRIR